VWDSSDVFLRTVGQRGLGPGEFARGALTILPAPDHQLYVLDNSRRVTVLDSSYDVVRATATSIGLGPGYSFVLADGTVLDGARPLDPDAYFDIKRATGAASKALPEVVRSIGNALDAERDAGSGTGERLVADAGNGRFRAGPPEGAGRGYEIELWSTAGVRVRTIRREVTWYPSGEADTEEQDLSDVPPAEFETLQVVGTGLVWVTLMVPNPKTWAAYARNPTDGAAKARAAQNYGELIDTEAGVVLARTGALDVGVAQRVMAWGWFPGSVLGYRPCDMPNGAPAFRILEARLRGK